MKKKSILLLISILVVSFGCGTSEKKDPYLKMSAPEIFHKGLTHVKNGNYAKAAEDFEGLESHYPFSDLSFKAQLYTIYAYYKAAETGSALAAAERFIRFYPTHPQVDYAYYLRGMMYYEDAFPAPQRYLALDSARRDKTNLESAFNEFKDLITRFPHSKYADDARTRLIYIKEILARYEVFAADYYLRRGAYVAALNRANYVVTYFQGTHASLEALSTMVKAYRLLGLFDLADDTLKTLKQNDPNHSSLKSL